MDTSDFDIFSTRDEVKPSPGGPGTRQSKNNFITNIFSHLLLSDKCISHIPFSRFREI